MRGFGILMAVAPFSIGLASAQSAAAPAPSFDSASVQAVPSAEDEFRSVLGTAIHGEIRLTNATMMECLRFAFGIGNSFQIEGPDWMQSGEYRYNVTGKAPANTSLDQLRLMLQNLLAQRFRMTLRRESKEFAFLALAVSPKGLKLRPARDGSDASGNTQVMGKISSNSMSMTQLTTLLSLFLGQPVLDRTGLPGWFELKLEWKPETAAGDDRAAVNQAVLGAGGATGSGARKEARAAGGDRGGPGREEAHRELTRPDTARLGRSHHRPGRLRRPPRSQRNRTGGAAGWAERSRGRGSSGAGHAGGHRARNRVSNSQPGNCTPNPSNGPLN